MNARRLLVLVVVGLLIASLCASAQDYRPKYRLDVRYIGQLFDDAIPTNFCARVTHDCESVIGAPFYFRGQEICSGQFYTAGYGFNRYIRRVGPLNYTGGMGIGCAYETWPPGLYEVEAIACKPIDFDSVETNGKKEFESNPVAVTILSPAWCGIFAGGKIPVDTFIDRWGFLSKNCWREVTMGFIYQTDFCCVDLGLCQDDVRQVQVDRAQRAELLVLDPKRCTRIKSCGNFKVWATGPCPDGSPSQIDSILVRGYCEFSQEYYTGAAQFEMTLTRDGQFEIEVFFIPGCVVYKTSGTIQCGGSDFRLDVCEDGG